jgi:hypothetical protein
VDRRSDRFAYDAVVHLRTLKLIEDYSTEDMYAANATEKAKAFTASKDFESMVLCLAADICESLATATTAHAARAAAAPSIASTVSVFLATDSADVRAPFAEQLAVGLELCLRARGTTPALRVEVDYFKEMPPAHFVVWTYPMDKVTTEQWRQIVGTTAEWLFLSQGRRMLMVRGLTGGNGGEAGMGPSSFAISAAFYGATPAVRLLTGSQKYGDANAKEPLWCKWSGPMSLNFSIPLDGP